MLHLIKLQSTSIGLSDSGDGEESVVQNKDNIGLPLTSASQSADQPQELVQ